jgi:hypothetical protein
MKKIFFGGNDGETVVKGRYFGGLKRVKNILRGREIPICGECRVIAGEAKQYGILWIACNDGNFFEALRKPLS